MNIYPYTTSIDIWSLGCILYELFAYEVLFKAENEITLLKKIIIAKGEINENLLIRSNKEKHM